VLPDVLGEGTDSWSSDFCQRGFSGRQFLWCLGFLAYRSLVFIQDHNTRPAASVLSTPGRVVEMGVLKCHLPGCQGCCCHAPGSLPNAHFGVPGPVASAGPWAGRVQPHGPAARVQLVFKNRSAGGSFYGTMPTRQLSCHSEHSACKRAVSSFCAVVYRTQSTVGFVWFQVPSDTEEELAGTGNTDVFRFPLSWKNLHGCVVTMQELSVPLHSLGRCMDNCKVVETPLAICKT